MEFNLQHFLTVSFTLFAVIDAIGSIPLLISLNTKMGGIREFRATIISGMFMVGFLYIGEPFLKLLGVTIHSFAIGGSIVIFLLGLEMVLGHLRQDPFPMFPHQLHSGINHRLRRPFRNHHAVFLPHLRQPTYKLNPGED